MSSNEGLGGPVAKAGQPTSGRHIPEPEDEAIRDLSRARSDVLRARQKARQQLRALLLRNGKRYPRKCAWTLAHRRWLCGFVWAIARQTSTAL